MHSGAVDPDSRKTDRHPGGVRRGAGRHHPAGREPRRGIPAAGRARTALGPRNHPDLPRPQSGTARRCVAERRRPAVHLSGRSIRGVTAVPPADFIERNINRKGFSTEESGVNEIMFSRMERRLIGTSARAILTLTSKRQ